MSAIVSTSGRLHSEFVRLLFLQDHRETDRFFAASGVQVAQHDRGLFHFRRTVFSSQLKSKIGNILAKAATLPVNLNLDGASITSRTHTHPSHSQTSRLLVINLLSIFRCSSPPSNPVYPSRVDPSVLVFSLSSQRHSYIGLLFLSHFIYS